MSAELVNDRFIVADHRAERAGDQVQLVLNDQGRRLYGIRIVDSEKQPGARFPWHHRKLVDRSDDEGRWALINAVVDDIDWKTFFGAKIAPRVLASELYPIIGAGALLAVDSRIPASPFHTVVHPWLHRTTDTRGR